MDTPSNNKHMSSEDFSVLLNSLPVAYVRPVDTEEGKIYAVCTADGTQLATFLTQDAAFFAARQNDLEPMFIH